MWRLPLRFITRPEVLIADEPTTALDVSIQAQILFQMRELAAEMGTAMVWISHDLAVVSSLASKLAVMYAGRIVEQGPTATLLRDPRHPYTAGLISSAGNAAGSGARREGGVAVALVVAAGLPLCAAM